MPTSFSQNSYAGYSISDFITRLKGTQEIFVKGLAALHNSVNKKLIIPRKDLTGSFMQEYQPSLSASGTFTIQERVIEPKDFSVYINNLDPRDWEKFWQELGTTVGEAFTFLQHNPKILRAFIDEVVGKVDEYLAHCVWEGEFNGAGSYTRFDGLLTTLLADGGYIDARPTSTAPALSASNINDAMDDVYDALLDLTPLYSKRNKAVMVSYTTAGYLLEAEKGISGKGRTALDMHALESLTYMGVPVIPVFGFPNDVILCTYVGTSALDTNLHVGVRNVSDMTNVQFEKLPNLSHYWGLRLDGAMGTRVGVPEDAILYDVRA